MDFNALLQEAQKLNNETNTSDSLPRVERSLPQVLQATRELHSRVTQTEAQDIQAYVSSIFAIHECLFKILNFSIFSLVTFCSVQRALNCQKSHRN